MRGQVIIASKRVGAAKIPFGFMVVDCTRNGPLGNPFVMKSETSRDFVCDQFDKMLARDFIEGGKLSVQVKSIAEEVKKGRNIALLCWCAPKRCHAESIKRRVEEWLNSENH